MKLGEITEKILSACFEVSNELGHGFLESVYEKALTIALRDQGLNAENQVALQVKFRHQDVGNFYADVIVEEKVLLELKAAKALASEHIAQTLSYLKTTGLEVGLLVNFGNPKLEYRRFENRFLRADYQG